MPMLTSSAARAAGHAAATQATNAASKTRLRKFHPFPIVAFDRVAKLRQQLIERALRDADADHRVEELARHATRSVVRAVELQIAGVRTGRLPAERSAIARKETGVGLPADGQFGFA